MYKLLIVDDENIEREGIKGLIKKYNIPLDCSEAKNGEEALEFLKNNHVDIMITDIKMPFLDGLNLLSKSKSVNSDLKTIIYSAYDKFDYAKKALENNSISYLLKPVDIDEFLNVVQNAIDLCKKEEKEEKRISELDSKLMYFEKKNCLMELIRSESISGNFVKRTEKLNINFEEMNIVMLIIDMHEKFFDQKNDEMEKIIDQLLELEYEYLNLNEYQSIIFIDNSESLRDKDYFHKLGNDIIYETKRLFGITSVLVFSKLIKAFDEFFEEYKKMEQKMEQKFFFRDSTVLFTEEETKNTDFSANEVDSMLDDIHKGISLRDMDATKIAVKHMFEKVKNNTGYSVVCVKYLCIETLKRMINKSPSSEETSNFSSYVEKIFSKSNIEELESETINMIEAHEIFSNKDNNIQNNVVKEVIDIINKEYMTDISLDYIADKVYLSPSYLSYLFKISTGMSFIKYLTEYRLNEATKLLDNTNMKVVDIGNNVGYGNLSYFCMLFKNHFGVTPAKYRERSNA